MRSARGEGAQVIDEEGSDATPPEPTLHAPRDLWAGDPNVEAVDALVDELVKVADATPRWDCEGARGPGNIPFTAAEARAALAAVPHAAEWVFFAWLEGGNWVRPWDDHDGLGDVVCRPCQRQMVDALLWWLVALHRYVGRQAGEGRARAGPH